MRCEDCGHDLRAIPEGTPCPECGVVTPMERRWPAPMPGTGRVLLGFAWPALVAMGLVPAAVIMADGLAGTGVVLMVITAVLVLLVAPLNTARRVHALMQRLPRRVRAAPLLVLVPRSVAVPVLAGIATIPVMMAIAFGGCLVAVVAMDAIQRPRTGSPAVPVTGPSEPAAKDAP
jgi:hypothetical protein